MKKDTQKVMNVFAHFVWNKAMKEVNSPYPFESVKRLRTCQAFVYETNGFYILKSYGTLVAVVRKSDGACVDFLRHEYGYTATSAKHIAKFFNDYAGWNSDRYTWRDV